MLVMSQSLPHQDGETSLGLLTTTTMNLTVEAEGGVASDIWRSNPRGKLSLLQERHVHLLVPQELVQGEPPCPPAVEVQLENPEDRPLRARVRVDVS